MARRIGDAFDRIRRVVGVPAREEVASELDFHLEMRVRELVAAGMEPAAARKRARERFGDLEGIARQCRQIATRRNRKMTWKDRLGDLARDAGRGVRQLRRHPAFSAMAVGTLAIGIAATTVIFGILRSVLLDPLPYPAQDRVAVLWSSWTGFPRTWLSYDEFEAFDTEIPSIERAAIFTVFSVNLAAADEPERVRAGAVSDGFFRILGVRPVLGRDFLPEEDVAGSDGVVILGHELWRRRYGGDPGIVGRTVEINGAPLEVVGVMPAGFRLPLDYGAPAPTELWVPLAATAEQSGAVAGPGIAPGGGNHGFNGVARLRPGATAESATREIEAWVERMGPSIYPPEMAYRGIAVSVREQVAGELGRALWVVLGAVAFLMLIACANVAGLLLVRGERRRGETSVRIALGADRSRLVRQVLLESALLAAAAAALGVLLAWVAVRSVRASAPASLPRMDEVALDPGVLAFAVLVSLGTVVLFGLPPAVAASRVHPADTLREEGRGATGARSRLRPRQALVVGQLALAVVLTASAGLMVRTVRELFAVDPGFHGADAVTMELSLPAASYPATEDVVGFYEELRRRVAEVPGVEAVGAARLLPLAAEMGDWGLTVEGYAPPPNQGTPGDWQVVTPGYFEAMGLRLVAGRVFDDSDRAGTAPVMVVNRTLARAYFGGRDPVGGRIRIGGDPERPWYTVVGVVDDVRQNALTREVKPQFYALHSQFPLSTDFTPRTMSLVVRGAGDPMSLVAPVRQIVRSMDPALPVASVRPMRAIIADSVSQPRFTMRVLALFSALALALSAIGVYGVVSQVVQNRRREFAIRSALGARATQLLRLSLSSALPQVLAGLALGTLAAVAATRLLRGLVYGVSTTDTATFALVVLTVAAAALLASLVPARRASRADPATAMRSA